MKIKIKIFIISLVLLANACVNNSKKVTDNNTCEDQLKKTKNDLSEVEDQLKANYNQLYPSPEDVSDQVLIPISEYRNTTNRIPDKNARYKPSGTIDSKKETLDLIIPVTENKLKIVNYINVSTPITNAILLVLDGNNGKGTNDKPITSVIRKKIKLKKIGLPSDIEKLFVFVLHDNNVNASHVLEYIDCLSKNPDYSRNNECLRTIGKLIPLERGGDIVP